jgi:hypothetical protein
MSTTPEEKKKREEVIENEKQIISQLNDLTDLNKRLRDGKAKNNLNVELEPTESPQKIASKDAEKSL